MQTVHLNNKLEKFTIPLGFSKVWPQISLFGMSWEIWHHRTAIERVERVLDMQDCEQMIPYTEIEHAMLPVYSIYCSMILHPKGVGRKKYERASVAQENCRHLLHTKFMLIEGSPDHGCTIVAHDISSLGITVVTIYRETKTHNMVTNMEQIRTLRTMLHKCLAWNA